MNKTVIRRSILLALILLVFFSFLIFIFSIKIVSAANGCGVGDPECGSNPANNCDITQNTTFNTNKYILPNGVDICAHNIILNCNNSYIF